MNGGGAGDEGGVTPTDGDQTIAPNRSVVVHEDNGGVRFNVLDDDGTVLMSSTRFDTAGDARDGFERARSIIDSAKLREQKAEGSGAGA